LKSSGFLLVIPIYTLQMVVIRTNPNGLTLCRKYSVERGDWGSYFSLQSAEYKEL
jgi:hypothetical protein